MQINPSTLNWLLSDDDPGPRYLALRDLCRLPADDAELQAARRLAHERGPIAGILPAMHPDGYWVEHGAGYYPKYTGTVWSLITLAQLGASIEQDERIARACEYSLSQTLAPGGQFTTNGAPSGTADCLQGNLCAALLDLGVDPRRLAPAFDWMARTVTGEGVAPMGDRANPQRYYAGKCGPRFACGANNKLPCAWGGVKVMLALGRLPGAYHTPVIERAVQAGIDFFLEVDPATAAYPNGWSAKPSGNWWKFGFPVFYITDLLQLVEALTRLGCAGDPRLANAIRLAGQKADALGRWPLEYDYAGKMWVDFGPKKAPNKWVTLRALKALK